MDGPSDGQKMTRHCSSVVVMIDETLHVMLRSDLLHFLGGIDPRPAIHQHKRLKASTDDGLL
jgi:hypothetical protein